MLRVSILLFETGFFIEPGTQPIQLDWLTCKAQRSSCLHWRYRCTQPYSDFYMDARDQKSGPHGCIAITLPMNSPPNSLLLYS